MNWKDSIFRAIKYLIFVSILLIGCGKKPYNVEHQHNGNGVFDVSDRDFKEVVRYQFRPCQCKIDSVKILSKKPIGKTENWYSGDGVHYEIEYIIYHKKQY